MSDSSFTPRKDKHNKKSPKKKTFFQELLSTFIYIIFITGIFLAVRLYLVAPVSVEGDSMTPTLMDEDRLLLNKVADIERFDIIVFPSPEDPSKQFIKRVIGLPGDEIMYTDQELYINGEQIDEPYLDLSMESLEVTEYYNGDFTLASLEGVEEVPEDSYFVLGDNRVNSKDSRSFGFIDQESITGRTAIRIWPFDRIGYIDGE